MDIKRRNLIALSAAALTGGGASHVTAQEPSAMYGLIGKMIAISGKRDELIAILLEGLDQMPGCLSYIVAKDPGDANAIWITEVWDHKTSHDSSLTLPAVRAAISKGKPLIASFGDSFVTTPIGGAGLNTKP